MTVSVVGGASTQSRGRRPLPPGAVSGLTLRGDGAHEWTEFTYADGHKQRRHLLTWCVGQHGCLFGHGPYPLPIARAIQSPAVPGSYGHRAEWALAEALAEALDGVFATGDLGVRFFQDGGTALAAAARIARHATGREIVASCGYHGAAQEWAHKPATAGICEDCIDLHARFEWGDHAAVWAIAKDAAAICVEVPPVDEATARAFLVECRRACDETGAIFILDEVVTGFRLGLTGAAGRYFVQPDIACYGKAISATGGVSAIVGRADLVNYLAEPVFLSTTFGGAPWPCSIAAATVRYLTCHADTVYPHLHRIGAVLQDGFNALGITCVGQPERSVVQFPTDSEWLAWSSAMVERGISAHRPQFPVVPHTMADVRKTLAVAERIQREGVGGLA